MPNTVALDQDFPSISASQALWERARGLIPAGTQTLAKGPTQYVDGVAPKYLARGKGCRVWDVDGNEFIDLSMAIGPVVLGYAHPAVDRAISQQLERGITFSLMHPLEVEVAELVRRVVPGADSVRFSKTGCDVTSAAVRLARAYTGRDKVLCCGYHGWHDWYIGTSPRSAGVPAATRALTEVFPYNDLLALLEALDEQVACVILEPTIFQAPEPDYLRTLKRACQAAGALLVFDEMWTGFRVALGGAQQRFDVVADLACFSKAVANGMPLSLLTGRADVMKLLEEDVFFFTTFGGEALSLAAAKVTIEELRELEVPARLEVAGRRLQEGDNQLAAKKGLSHTKATGLPCRTIINFDASAGDPLLQKSLVQQELIRHGVLWTGFHNLCLAHGDAEIEHVLKAYDRALDTLSSALARGTLAQDLRGKPVQAVFRKTR
ncbi:MAG TPA: aminotransferase class III-fold pyridoxal phosphate-dependent enzyme [Polyangiaceae bacterium]|nr:aminotransferase class III-fold pyridoxal phosphate-dependent enzyme [Polyangiaceae bacterium]